MLENREREEGLELDHDVDDLSASEDEVGKIYLN